MYVSFELVLYMISFQVPKLLLSAKNEENFEYQQSDFYENFSLIHKNCNKKNNSPRKFMAFIQNFKNIYAKKCGEIDSRKKHLQVFFM